MANVDETLLRDLLFDGDFERTSSGDLQVIDGIANLKQALYARLLTVPGTLVHRPTYGVGLKLYQNNISTFSQQTALANKIQEQFLLDPRVVDVTAISIDTTDDKPEMTKINVSVIAQGFTDAVQMEFVPFGGSGAI